MSRFKDFGDYMRLTGLITKTRLERGDDGGYALNWTEEMLAEACRIYRKYESEPGDELLTNAGMEMKVWNWMLDRTML